MHYHEYHVVPGGKGTPNIGIKGDCVPKGHPERTRETCPLRFSAALVEEDEKSGKRKGNILSKNSTKGKRTLV